MSNFQNAMANIKATHPHMHEAIDSQGNSITKEQVAILAPVHPHIKCAVRTNLGRFVCAMQYVAHFVAIIEQHENCMVAAGYPELTKGDYVRFVEIAE